MSFPLPQNVNNIPNAVFNSLMREMVVMQNGHLAEQMKRNGLNYNLNYGVTITVLKQLVASTKPNNSLAFLLWNQNIREPKIMATWLFIVSELSKTQVQTILQTVTTTELAEQLAKNSLYTYKNIDSLIDKTIITTNYQLNAVILTVGRALYNNIIDTKTAINILLKIIDTKLCPNQNNCQQPLIYLLQNINKQADSNIKQFNQLIKTMQTCNIDNFSKAANQFLWLNS